MEGFVQPVPELGFWRSRRIGALLKGPKLMLEGKHPSLPGDVSVCDGFDKAAALDFDPDFREIFEIAAGNWSNREAALRFCEYKPLGCEPRKSFSHRAGACVQHFAKLLDTKLLSRRILRIYNCIAQVFVGPRRIALVIRIVFHGVGYGMKLQNKQIYIFFVAM